MTHPGPTLAQPTGAIPSLDGIRAVAVLLVFVAHSGFDHLVPGGLGVTIFFVLSGFLITTLMRIEHARSGSIDLRSFYLRRLLRLMPPLLVVVTAAGLLATASLIDRGFTWAGLSATLLYYGNYHMIAHDFSGVPAGLGVVWSLAIEEHYYLLYPPLALLLLRMRRIGRGAVLLGVLCAFVLAWRCVLVANGASTDYVMMASDTRVDAILFGCLMALARNPWLDRVAPLNAAREGALALLCIAVLIVTFVYRDEVFRMTLRYTLQGLAITALLYLAVARAERWPFRWLSAPLLVYIGSISYTVYLSHHVILLGLGKHWPAWHPLLLTTVGALLTLGFAEAMRRWIEQPVARLRRRLHGAAVTAHPAPELMPAGAR